MSFETPHSSLDYSTPRASLDGIPAPMYPQVRTRCTPPSRLLSPPTLHPPPCLLGCCWFRCFVVVDRCVSSS